MVRGSDNTGPEEDGVPHGPEEDGVPHGPEEDGVPHGPEEDGVPHGPEEDGVPHGPEEDGVPHGPEEDGVPHGPEEDGVPHGPEEDGVPHGASISELKGTINPPHTATPLTVNTVIYYPQQSFSLQEQNVLNHDLNGRLITSLNLTTTW
nr:circumsporozoite protein-like [Procambarus clarkii]